MAARGTGGQSGARDELRNAERLKMHLDQCNAEKQTVDSTICRTAAGPEDG